MSERKQLDGAVADCHIHPDYSFDAQGTVDEYCRAAFDAGLTEICFTTHFDPFPGRLEKEGYMVINGGREKLSVDSVRHYLDDVARVAEEYGKIGLLVRAGLEFGYYPGCEKLMQDLQKQVELYMRLCGVHLIDDRCICCKEEAAQVFASLSLTQFADRYFALLDQAAGTGLFDCLAHVDVYRRFGRSHYGDEILTIHRGRIEKLFDTMRAHGVGFEVNTSAIRHGLVEYYPTMEIINLAREHGIQLMTLGSDAHKPSDIALDFEAAMSVAYELTPYVDE